MNSFRDQTLYLSPGEGRFVFGFFLRGGGWGMGMGFTWLSMNGG